MNTYSYSRIGLTSKYLNKEVQFGKVRFGSGQGPASGTVYFFHGGNGDDRQLEEAGLLRCVQGALWEKFSKRNIQLVLPFVGKDFLRGGRGGNDADHGRYFMEEVIAAAEAGSGTSDSSRWIGGLSMGGMAALSVFLRHPARFCGVGAHFPTLVDFDFHNDSEVQGYARANGVPDGYRDLLISDLRAAFPSLGFFRENDPIALARALPEKALAGKTLCLDVGSGDEFGLHAGARVFHELLERRGIPHAFEVVEGGKHDAPFLVQRFPLLLDALLG